MKRRNICYPHSVTVEKVTDEMKSWLKANDVAPYCANVNGRHSYMDCDEDGGHPEYVSVPGTEAVSFWKKDAATRFEAAFGDRP